MATTTSSEPADPPAVQVERASGRPGHQVGEPVAVEVADPGQLAHHVPAAVADQHPGPKGRARPAGVDVQALLGKLVGALVRLAFSLVRPVLLALGALKIYEEFEKKQKS